MRKYCSDVLILINWVMGVSAVRAPDIVLFVLSWLTYWSLEVDIRRIRIPWSSFCFLSCG